MFFCWLPVNKMIGTYSRFIWCSKIFPLLTSVCHHLRLVLSFGNLCHFKIWTWDFISRLSGWLLSLLHIPTQHLSFLTISFHTFLSVCFNDNFVALFSFCLQIFHPQTSQKKWRDMKVQSPISHSRKMAAETRESFILALYSACNMLEIVGSL